MSTSTARFLDDPSHQGTGVPESLNSVVALGATVDEPRYAASLRMRYFGPRTLDTQGDAKSPPSTIWSTQFTLKLHRNERLTFDMFNIFNADVPDVTYYYNSWLPYDAKNPANANNPAINPALGANIDGSPGFAGTGGRPRLSLPSGRKASCSAHLRVEAVASFPTRPPAQSYWVKIRCSGRLAQQLMCGQLMSGAFRRR